MFTDYQSNKAPILDHYYRAFVYSSTLSLSFIAFARMTSPQKFAKTGGPGASLRLSLRLVAQKTTVPTSGSDVRKEGQK